MRSTAFNRPLKMGLYGKILIKVMAAVFLLPLLSYSQNPIYRIAENINTCVSAGTDIPDRIIGNYFQDKLYTTASNSGLGQLLAVSEFNLITGASRQLTIKKNKTNGSLFGSPILALITQGNKLYVLNSSYLNILKIEGDHLIFHKAIENKPAFNAIHRLGKGALLLSVNYNFHPSDEAYKHTWAKLDVSNDSLSPESHREDANAKFSYFTNSWLSTYKGLIAYARTSDYNIKFYDHNFLLKDSIVTKDFDPNLKVLHLVPKGNDYSTDEMKRISAASDTLLYRIEKIFLIDSTRILVTIKQPKSKIYRFDLWKKTAHDWVKTTTQFVESGYIPGKRYTPENNQIHGFFGNHAILVGDEKGHLYNYYYPFRNNVLSESFNMEKDVIEPQNELTRKNQLYFGIRKIEFGTH